jgi:hypothetical protein
MHEAVPPETLRSGAGSSHPEFLRGYEAGRIAARIELLGRLTLRETISRDNLEVVGEMADAAGRRYQAEIIEHDWMVVTIDPLRGIRYSLGSLRRAVRGLRQREEGASGTTTAAGGLAEHDRVPRPFSLVARVSTTEAMSLGKILTRLGIVAAPLRYLVGLSGRGNGNGNGNGNGSETSAMKLPPLVDDPIGLWQVRDLGGPMSKYSGPPNAGADGVLARIELNIEDGKDPWKGLPENPLQAPAKEES